MAYSEKQNEYNKKYVKEKQKQVVIKYRKEDWENCILPNIKETGLPVAAYIKEAINEKIIRQKDNL